MMANTSNPAFDTQYQQFLQFQRMQWEQLKEFQQMRHFPSQSAAPRPTEQPTVASAAAAQEPPLPAGQSHHPRVTSPRIRSPQSKANSPVGPTGQEYCCPTYAPPQSQQHAARSAQQGPSVEDLFRALLSSGLCGQQAPTQTKDPSKSSSARQSSWQLPQTPVKQPSSPRENKPALSTQSSVPVEKVTPPAPAARGASSEASPAKPSPMEHFESLSEDLSSVENKLGSADDHPHLQGQLMKILLELDQVECPSLLRPVRKSLVAQANSLMDRLDAAQASSPAPSADSAPAEQDAQEKPNEQENDDNAQSEAENLTASITEALATGEECSAESLDDSEVVTIETVTPGGPEQQDARADRADDSSTDEVPEEMEDWSFLADSLTDLFPAQVPSTVAA